MPILTPQKINFGENVIFLVLVFSLNSLVDFQTFLEQN